MRKLNLAILAGTGLALSGCMGIGGANLNRSVDSVHQPVVERSQFVIDLNMDNMNGIAPSEAQRLDQWLGMLGVGYGDRIGLDFGMGYGNRRAEEEIGRIVSRRGLLISNSAPVAAAPYTPGTVRIVVTRSTASVPECPDWDKKAATNLGGSTHSNYGCAVNSNLAAMVANPEDLVSGRGASIDDPRSGVRAIRDYQEAGPNYNAGALGSGVSGQKSQ